MKRVKNYNRDIKEGLRSINGEIYESAERGQEDYGWTDIGL